MQSYESKPGRALLLMAITRDNPMVQTEFLEPGRLLSLPGLQVIVYVSVILSF